MNPPPKNYARLYPRFWLYYYVLSLAFWVVNIAFDLLWKPESLTLASVLGVVLAALGFRALYGYCRQRRYDPLWLWKLVFIVHALGLVLSTGLVLYIAGTNPSGAALIAGASLIVSLPHVFAMHQYAYRSPHLWETDKATTSP